jgi:tetratricopeptide (TPR) repeat protein
MSNLHKLKRRAAELEQKRQFDRAIELYCQLLDDAGKELPDDDVPLYNRVGDLLVRRGSVSDALTYYERAVDLYAERGFLNNAIALCSKILRQSPGRATVYYKLGKISARKGFKSDARKNFLEYADRMQKSGQLDEAFRALKEFAALYPDQDDIRLILADLLSRENRKGEALEQLLSLHEKLEAEGRDVEARATLDRMKAIDPDVQPRASGVHAAQQPNALVFLDVSGDVAPRRETPSAPPSAGSRAATAQGLAPALDGLRVTFVPEGTQDADRPAPDAAPAPVPAPEPEEAAEPVAMIEGFEATAATSVTPPEALEPLDRTGDFATVEEPVEEVEAPLQVEAAIRELEREVASAAPVEGFEATAIDLDTAAPDETGAAGDTDDDAAPLSVREFEALPLTEVERPAEERRHDLALPSRLPRLRGSASTGEEAPPPPAMAVEAADDPSLTSEIPAIEDLGVLRRREEPPAPVNPVNEVAPEPAVTPEAAETASHPAPDPVPAEPQPEPEYPGEVSTYAADDLLGTPPSFGIQPSGDAPAFPPLAGLSDDINITGRPPSTPDEIELPGEFSALTDPSYDPIGFDAPTFTPAGSTPVSAPVPEGLETPQETPADTTAPPPAHGSHKQTSEEPAHWGTPKSVVTLGGAEGHLRRRLELEPGNWALHRQLGETLLEAGDREAGLAELERAMVGFESAGELDKANETAEEIIRVQPGSVNHHQKRVEYAVRAKDRDRLIGAYLDLADALFRSGAGEKSVTVYTRVAELDPGNERAQFALSTLAPDRIPPRRAAASANRWSNELEAIGAPRAPVPPREPPRRNAPAREERPKEPVKAAATESRSVPPKERAREPESTERAKEPEPKARTKAPEPRKPAREPEPRKRTKAAEPEPAMPTPVPIEALAPTTPAHAVPASPEQARKSDARKAPTAPDAASAARDGWRTPPPPPVEAPPPQSAPRSGRKRSADAERGQFVDLGEWLREGDVAKSTRMIVEDAKPTGDEAADFAELLRRFKRGLAENVDPEDFEAHYDLGVAFKEMGLMEEAIAEFQKSLRGDTHRVRSYEALGQCFVETGQYPIAAALLQRAVETTRVDDQELVGVLYLLGFASEQLGRKADALRYYQRVFAVDIQFRDIAQRVSSMEHQTE